jgi:hypothetical protein
MSISLAAAVFAYLSVARLGRFVIECRLFV